MDQSDKYIKATKEFDSFLTKCKEGSIYKKFGLFVRTYHTCLYEMGSKSKIREITTTILSGLYRIFLLFFTRPCLTKNSEFILLESTREDKTLAKNLRIESVHIVNKPSLNLKALHLILIWIKVSSRLISQKNLNRYHIFKSLPVLLSGIHCYYSIKLDNIKTIITSRDYYAIDQAILLKAKESGIKTIKIDYFPILGKAMKDRLYCEYYFYQNEFSKEIFQSFTWNKDIKFIPGGNPYYDKFSKLKYNPVKNPRVISFWTQRGTEIGLKNVDSYRYIEDIISIMPKDYILYIKIHPMQDPQLFQKYESDKVKIIKHGEMDNNKIMEISSFIFAVTSTTSFEAKHFNRNSFLINYEPNNAFDCIYDKFSSGIDLIKNKKELKKVLDGKVTPKTIKDYLKVFNKTYPNTTRKLSKFIRENQKSD